MPEIPGDIVELPMEIVTLTLELSSTKDANKVVLGTTPAHVTFVGVVAAPDDATMNGAEFVFVTYLTWLAKCKKLTIFPLASVSTLPTYRRDVSPVFDRAVPL